MQLDPALGSEDGRAHSGMIGSISVTTPASWSCLS